MFLGKGVEVLSKVCTLWENPERCGDLNGAYMAEFKWWITCFLHEQGF